MSNSVRPHRRQPARLPHPWDSPGKNSGVGCHFLLQCMKVKSESEVAHLCLTLSNPMDCSLPGSSVHGIFQARVLENIPTSNLVAKARPSRLWSRAIRSGESSHLPPTPRRGKGLDSTSGASAFNTPTGGPGHQIN